MSDNPNKALEDILQKVERDALDKLDRGEDKPHNLLVAHLKAILDDADMCQFHDYLNVKYSTPKVELIMQLERIIINAKAGLYDN